MAKRSKDFDPEELLRRIVEEDEREIGLSVVTLGISKEASLQDMQDILGELGQQGYMLQSSITMDDGYLLVMLPMGVLSLPKEKDWDDTGVLFDSGKMPKKKIKH